MEFDENLFKVANETLVKSLSRKRQSFWLPNLSQWDSDHLHLFSLVRRKSSKFGFSRKRYTPLQLKLVHVVKQRALPEVNSDELDAGNHTKKVSMSLSGSLKAKFADVFDGDISGKTACTLDAQIGQTYKTELRRQELIDALVHGRVDMQHTVMQELADQPRVALCVVTGVIRARSSPKLIAMVNAEGNAGIGATPVPSASFKAEAGMKYKTLREYTVPEGSVLAYKVTELQINITTGVARMMVSKIQEKGFHVFDCIRGGNSAVRSFVSELVQSNVGFTGGKQGIQHDGLDETALSAIVERAPASLKDSVKAAFKPVPQADRVRLVELLLEIGSCHSELAQLVDLLESDGSAVSEDEAIQEVMRIAQQCTSLEPVQMVCAALASLDEETRYYLSSVELRNLSFVLDLIATTFEGETVALQDPRLLALFSESRTRDLLIAGLDYQVCNEGLLPAPGSYELLEATFMALKIFTFILE